MKILLKWFIYYFCDEGFPPHPVLSPDEQKQHFLNNINFINPEDYVLKRAFSVEKLHYDIEKGLPKLKKLPI